MEQYSNFYSRVSLFSYLCISENKEKHRCIKTGVFEVIPNNKNVCKPQGQKPDHDHESKPSQETTESSVITIQSTTDNTAIHTTEQTILTGEIPPVVIPFWTTYCRNHTECKSCIHKTVNCKDFNLCREDRSYDQVRLCDKHRHCYIRRPRGYIWKKRSICNQEIGEKYDAISRKCIVPEPSEYFAL